jgi:hypothetical protein
MIYDDRKVLQFDIGLDTGLYSEFGNWVFDPECANFRFRSEFANKMVTILPFHFDILDSLHSDSMNPVIIPFDLLKLGIPFQNQLPLGLLLSVELVLGPTV